MMTRIGNQAERPNFSTASTPWDVTESGPSPSLKTQKITPVPQSSVNVRIQAASNNRRRRIRSAVSDDQTAIIEALTNSKDNEEKIIFILLNVQDEP